MTARRAFPGCILAACTLAGGAPIGVASAAELPAVAASSV